MKIVKYGRWIDRPARGDLGRQRVVDRPALRDAVVMTLDEAIDRMMTCASAAPCPREDACFEVVKWAKAQRAQARIAEATAKARQQEEAKEQIAHYAPQWEAPCGIPMIDWDAA